MGFNSGFKGSKKEFDQFIEMVMTEIYGAAYSLVLA